MMESDRGAKIILFSSLTPSVSYFGMNCMIFFSFLKYCQMFEIKWLQKAQRFTAPV